MGLRRFLGLDESLETRHTDYDPSAFPLEWQLDAVIWHQGRGGFSSESVPAVYAALDLISAAIAQLDTSPETPLTRTPDLFDSRFSFFFETVYSLAAAGDAYWLLTPTERGIETLQVLPPGDVAVSWDEDLPRRRRSYEWNGSPRESRYIRHLRFHPRPGELLGLSPIEAARLTWEGAAASEVWGSSLFGASGVPSGVLEVPTPLTPAEATALREDWNTARNGMRNTAVLSGGMKYTPVELSPADIEWLETRASNAQEVARIFHIPSDFLEVAVQGGGSSITYKSLAEVGADLVQWCLRPYIRLIEEAWVSIPGQPPIRFDTSPLYEESLEARARTLQILTSAGANPDQAAEVTGFTDLSMESQPSAGGAILNIIELPPFEIRSEEEEGDGRTIEGRLLSFGEVVEVEGVRESFRPGVFSGTDPESVVVLWQHDRTQPIGRMTDLREERDGYYGTLRLATTPRALEAATLSAERVIRGLSVGFLPGQSSRRNGVREHTSGKLIEISLVTFPAIPGAEVTATREEAHMEETPTVEITEEAANVSIDLAPLEAQMEAHSGELREMRNHLANLTTGGIATPVPEMSLTAAYAELLQMVAEHPAENRALADVIGTAPGNASGLIRDAYISELLGVLSVNRPLFSAAGTVGFPSSGYGIAFPQVTQHTLVGKRGAEKTQIPTRELIVGGVTYPMEWFAGGVDVALELIAQSDPSVVEVVVGDLLDQYAMATEIEFSADAVAASTAGGAALDFTDWSNFVAGMVTTSSEIRAATGLPGNLLALTDASWLALVKILNPDQPSISFGTGPDFTAESVAVGGIVAFHAPYLTVDLQFNTKALRKSERPPDTVTATNVALMGRDIGILGATIALPLYPAGIIKHATAA